VEAYVHDAAHDMRIARDQLDATLDELNETDYARYVPYGSRTVHDVLAHLAAADHVWALAAQGLLKGEADARAPLSVAEAAEAKERAIDRGRAQTPAELRQEMARRRKLLLGLYELLERRHLSMTLPTFGETHNSVRERIWLGYHDRLHKADIERALRMVWHPQGLAFQAEVRPAVAALTPDPMLYVIFGVDPSCWGRQVRGLEWTYRELLSHIATGDWVLQGHLRHVIEHGRVGAWPDIDAGNAQRLEERRFSNDCTLVDEYLSMRHETLRLIARLKPEHLKLDIDLWFRPKREEPYTMLDYLLGFDNHDRNHAEQLRPAMKHATSTR
jgi:uncharacterized damage-inducible protein DinB